MRIFFQVCGRMAGYGCSGSILDLVNDLSGTEQLFDRFFPAGKCQGAFRATQYGNCSGTVGPNFFGLFCSDFAFLFHNI